MNQLQTWQSLTPSVTAGDCHQRASDQTDDMATPSPSVFNRGALGAVIADPLPTPPLPTPPPVRRNVIRYSDREIAPALGHRRGPLLAPRTRAMGTD